MTHQGSGNLDIVPPTLGNPEPLFSRYSCKHFFRVSLTAGVSTSARLTLWSKLVLSSGGENSRRLCRYEFFSTSGKRLPERSNRDEHQNQNHNHLDDLSTAPGVELYLCVCVDGSLTISLSLNVPVDNVSM